MKKLVLLLTLMFALQAAIMAQVTTGNITFNAHLNQTFNLIIVSGDVQEINFNNAADYNNGVDQASGGIAPGFSLINIEATEDWNLTIECPDFLPFSFVPPNPGSGVIPIDNLGYTITSSGAHSLVGGEVDYLAGNPDPVALTNATAPCISLGTVSNAGDITDNAFTLHWQMGTMLGDMHATSMFDQMAAGDFTTGDFQAIALLTLNPAP
jgi:hypothetical protein